MEKSKLRTALENLKNNISEKIQDAASLEVTTFTGDFVYKVADIVKSDQNKFEIEKVLKQLSMKTNVDLQLVAYSRVSIDADVATIVKSNLNTQDRELLNFHQNMIETSQKSRRAIVEMVFDLLDK